AGKTVIDAMNPIAEAGPPFPTLDPHSAVTGATPARCESAPKSPDGRMEFQYGVVEDARFLLTKAISTSGAEPGSIGRTAVRVQRKAESVGSQRVDTPCSLGHDVGPGYTRSSLNE